MLRNREFTRADPRLGWLQAVLPSGTRTVASVDGPLACRLAEAGFLIGGEGCDAEIGGPATGAPGSAGTVVAFVQRSEVRHRARTIRAAGRLIRSRTVRHAARARAAALGMYGYHATVLWSQRGEPLPLLGAGDAAGARPFAHRFPLGAVVVGRRDEQPTLLEEALWEARAATGVDLTPTRVAMGSSGIVLVHAPTALARFACGDARDLLDRQATNITMLETAGAHIARRVPRLLGSGSTERVRWTVTSRLEGEAAATPVVGAALADCVSFLVALFAVPGADAPPIDLRRVARLLGDAAPALRRDLADVASHVQAALSGMPRGFAHLDFWGGNLLVRDGRLSGVVDWISGGPGRPPLLDLLHLRLSDAREPANRRLGPAFLDHVWPLGPRDDAVVAEYCDRLGLDVDERAFRALLAAYWLLATARELWDSADGEDVGDPAWRRDNIDRVLEVIIDEIVPMPGTPNWRRAAVPA